MDILAVGVWFFAVGVWAFAGSFLCTLLVTGYGVAQFEKRLKSIEMTEKSYLGVQAKQENSEEMQAVMLEAAGILKDENISKEDKPKRLIALAMQHPGVAMKLINKFGLKGVMG
jgi:hypothetical protein